MFAFDADQEFYANQYLKIVKEQKMTLLGIETSVGGMFVGPLYTYASTFIYFLSKGSPLGIFWVTLVIASTQASLTYLLFTKLKNEKVGRLAGFLVLVSGSLWNKAFAPSLINLLYPAGLFFFYVLVRLKKEKKYFLHLGLLLGFATQIHFSLLFFYPITIIYLFWQKMVKRKYLRHYFLIKFIVLLSLLPLILFDIRHGFFILGNAWKFITGRLFYPSVDTGVSWVLYFSNMVRGLFELFTHIIVPKPTLAIYLFIVSVLIFFLIKLKKEYIYRVVAFMYGTSFLLFFLYRGDVPDYYWYFLLPGFFFVVSDFLLVCLDKKILKYVAYLLLVFTTLQNLEFMNNTLNHYNFRLKSEVVKYINGQSRGKTVKISYDTDLGLGFGFDYLLRREGVKMDNNNFEENYQIVIRNSKNFQGKEFREPGSPVSIKVVKLDQNL